jgi:branched-chain amino acid transport system ATP-binding protein
MLEVEGIHTFYGLSHILFGVSLKVDPGEVVCLLGTKWSRENNYHEEHHWHHPPKQGSIKFKGEEIIGIEPYLLTRKGIGYIPDDRRIFADPTVGENLEIAERKAGK